MFLTSTMLRLSLCSIVCQPGVTNMLASGLVDELVIYQAPHIMGSESRGMFVTPDWQTIEQRLNLNIVEVRNIGADLKITARPER